MKFNLLVVDTESTGLPIDWKAPSSDSANWPHICQLAASLYQCDTDIKQRRRVACFSSMVRPDGYTIPEDATKINGITTEMATRYGRPLFEVLQDFMVLQEEADYFCSHNVSFDGKVIRAAAHRLNAFESITKIPSICTMRETTKWCNLPGPRGPKFPKIQELYDKLFNEAMPDAHDAFGDIEAVARCFFRLIYTGVFTEATFTKAVEDKKKIEAAVVAKAERLAKEAEAETTTTNKE